MTRFVGIFIAFVMLIYGLSFINDWYYEHTYQYKEGDTLEDIAMDIDSDVITVGAYVSFYIEDYVDKTICVDDGIEYEIYTMLVEIDESDNTYSYIQVKVKEEDTKQKLNNLKEDKVYFQGEVIEVGSGDYTYDEALNTGIPEGMDIDREKIISNYVIVESEIPDEGYGWILGIVIIILAVALYYMCGGIKAIGPTVEIKADKFLEYDNIYCTDIHNINNELLCEKDNLKRLKSEQIESKKTDNIMTIMFCIGVLLLCCGNVIEFLHSIVLGILEYRVILMVIYTVLKILGIILILISIGGVWSRFINSSHKLAVYIAVKRRKRSIYVEIEKCKKNIEYLEKIIDEKNREEIEGIFVK